MTDVDDIVQLLRETCREYKMTPRAVFQTAIRPAWPLLATTEEELEQRLAERGHFVPLPKEPAALANVIEVSVVDFLFDRLAKSSDVDLKRGTERGYPDIEILIGGKYYAVDVKVARRRPSGRQTQSRITLYTGNTYFRYPQLHWAGTFRPFEDYAAHLDIIVLYTFDEGHLSRIADLEILVHESWRIASRQRSSTTREYIGAVQSIEALRAGHGEFESIEEFYGFWKKFNFKIGRAVQQQLDRLLKHAKKRS